MLVTVAFRFFQGVLQLGYIHDAAGIRLIKEWFAVVPVISDRVVKNVLFDTFYSDRKSVV